MTPDEWLAKYGTDEGWAKAYGLPGVCRHEDCPYPVAEGDPDCGNHEEWMT